MGIRGSIWGVGGFSSRQPTATSFLFGGGEENQHFQLFLDVVEAVVDAGFDEDYRSRAHSGILRADLHAGPPADNVVHLVFAMRFLRVGAAGWQHVNARAHRRNPQEFQVEFLPFSSLAIHIVNVEEMSHRTLRTRVGLNRDLNRTVRASYQGIALAMPHGTLSTAPSGADAGNESTPAPEDALNSLDFGIAEAMP
jgi:hypothetical protein